MTSKYPKYIILSGGIGGAKLVEGFYNSGKPQDILVLSNTGDDLIRFGLRICPDIDIVLYTLANLVNRKKLWGIDGDTFHALKMLETYYSEPQWFNIGDMDFGTHIFRTDLLNKGISLSKVTERICLKLGVKCRIVPMAEEYVPTYLDTDIGVLHFEEYFVKNQTKPKIKRIIFGGSKKTKIPGGILEMFDNSERIIISPSNPILSIAPILAIPAYSEILRKNRDKVIAVSPIIQGKAVKGPTIEVMRSLNLKASSSGVAEYYRDICKYFIFDNRDEHYKEQFNLGKCNMSAIFFDTLMTSLEKKKELALFLKKINI